MCPICGDGAEWPLLTSIWSSVDCLRNQIAQVATDALQLMPVQGGGEEGEASQTLTQCLRRERGRGSKCEDFNSSKVFVWYSCQYNTSAERGWTKSEGLGTVHPHGGTRCQGTTWICMCRRRTPEFLCCKGMSICQMKNLSVGQTVPKNPSHHSFLALELGGLPQTVLVIFQNCQSNNLTHFTQQLARCAGWDCMRGLSSLFIVQTTSLATFCRQQPHTCLWGEAVCSRLLSLSMATWNTFEFVCGDDATKLAHLKRTDAFFLNLSLCLFVAWGCSTVDKANSFKSVINFWFQLDEYHLHVSRCVFGKPGHEQNSFNLTVMFVAFTKLLKLCLLSISILFVKFVFFPFGHEGAML